MLSGAGAQQVHETWRGEDVQGYLSGLIDWVESDRNIDVFLNSQITQVDGFVGNFKTTVTTQGQSRVLEHGVTLIASGASELKPDQYLYGQDSRVVTGLELQQRFIDKDPRLRTPGYRRIYPVRGLAHPGTTVLFQGLLYPVHQKRPETQRDQPGNGCRCSVPGLAFVRVTGRSISSGPVPRHRVCSPRHGQGIVAVGDREDLKVILCRSGAGTIDGDPARSFGTCIRHRSGRKKYLWPSFTRYPLMTTAFLRKPMSNSGPWILPRTAFLSAVSLMHRRSIDESITQAQAAAARAVTVLSMENIKMGGIVSQIFPNDVPGAWDVSMSVLLAPSHSIRRSSWPKSIRPCARGAAPVRQHARQRLRR